MRTKELNMLMQTGSLWQAWLWRSPVDSLRKTERLFGRFRFRCTITPW
jgi:hypothetical protein